MHCHRGNPSELPYICIVDAPKMGNLVTPYLMHCCAHGLWVWRWELAPHRDSKPQVKWQMENPTSPKTSSQHMFQLICCGPYATKKAKKHVHDSGFSAKAKKMLRSRPPSFFRKKHVLFLWCFFPPCWTFTWNAHGVFFQRVEGAFGFFVSHIMWSAALPVLHRSGCRQWMSQDVVLMNRKFDKGQLNEYIFEAEYLQNQITCSNYLLS